MCFLYFSYLSCEQLSVWVNSPPCETFIISAVYVVLQARI